MNNQLAKNVIQYAINRGVKEFCLAAGKRNAPLVYALDNNPEIKVYYWPEERSAAFFALGRIRATGRPVAVITTSGTAVGNLLPAAMEAYYTHLPLLLMTVDRPRRQRGTGAPQCAEQVGIFSYYARFMQDIAQDEECYLYKWALQGPAHLNICFEEPEEEECQEIYDCTFQFPSHLLNEKQSGYWDLGDFTNFIETVNFPLVLVGALKEVERESVVQFLLRLKAPIYLEGASGLREDPRLAHWRINIDRTWRNSMKAQYPIDGILRIGSIPTCRIWRDLEEKKGSMQVCSISDLPFSGLSWTDSICVPFQDFFEEIQSLSFTRHYPCEGWLKDERILEHQLIEIYHDEPHAEVSLIHDLSKLIPSRSLVYLGNSLPIREWDQAATWEPKYFDVAVSRGLCGIDGQISTFLGLSKPEQENWAIIGDLTALYDMVAPWILNQLPDLNVNLVIINNAGGQIFSRMFSNPAFINHHALQFGPLADFWKWHYEKWERVPENLRQVKGGRLIEIIPDPHATERALKRMKKL